jgi:hypothetical protein
LLSFYRVLERALHARTLSTILAISVLLAGCQPPPAPPPAALAPLPPHAGPPPAATCQVAPFAVPDGGTTNVSVTVSNEGGYCAAKLTASSGKPFDAPLVPVLPLHGTPHVIKYNGQTSVEYTPTAGYLGHDSFIVKLILRGQPGYTTLNMSVTVQGH